MDTLGAHKNASIIVKAMPMKPNRRSASPTFIFMFEGGWPPFLKMVVLTGQHVQKKGIGQYEDGSQQTNEHGLWACQTLGALMSEPENMRCGARQQGPYEHIDRAEFVNECKVGGHGDDSTQQER